MSSSCSVWRTRTACASKRSKPERERERERETSELNPIVVQTLIRKVRIISLPSSLRSFLPRRQILPVNPTQSPSRGKKNKFGHFLVVVQLILRLTQADISCTAMARLFFFPLHGSHPAVACSFTRSCLFSAISRPRFRSSESGKALPSPRLVSIVVHADVSHLHGRYTLMLMQYGQFLDHDITLTPINKVRLISKFLFSGKQCGQCMI